MVEDKVIAMHARHAIAKTPLDITELMIFCNRGVIDLAGKVKRPRNVVSTGGFNMKKEFEVMIYAIRGSKGVKDVMHDRVVLIE